MPKLHKGSEVNIEKTKLPFFQDFSLPGLFFIAAAFFLLFHAALAEGGNVFSYDDSIENKADQFGSDTLPQIKAWVTLIRDDSCVTDMEKLQKVNRFFNRMRFVEDMIHWGVEDYWATPVEFLGTSGGDCEDFALAKFFTLKAMGINEQQLYITYEKTLNPRRVHMVLTYHSSPEAIPLVLDNLTSQIEMANKRRDILLVYGFNCSNFRVVSTRGLGQELGKSDRLKRWQDVQRRIN